MEFICWRWECDVVEDARADSYFKLGLVFSHLL